MSTKKLARELGIIRKRRQSKESGQTKRPGSKQYFSYLIIIDFESTCWREKNNYGQEIIEFPAVLLNTSTGDVESEFHTYVQPQEHPVLSEFCTELTGITQAQVEAGVPLGICLSRFSRWLQALQQERGVAFLRGGKAPLATGSPCAFVTWSDWDLGVCLLYECKRKQICKPEALNSWIDLRATYKLFYSRKPKGLNGALQDLGIEFDGREHSGLDDARNTARLAWRMITDGCFMKITKSLDRAPLKAKPLFPNGPVQKASSDQQQQGPASNTETTDGAPKTLTEGKIPQSAAKPSPDTTTTTIAHTSHKTAITNYPLRNNNNTTTTTMTYPLNTNGTNHPSTISVVTNLPTSTTSTNSYRLPTTTHNPLLTNNHNYPNSISRNLPTTTSTTNNSLTTTTATNNNCQFQSLVTPKTVLNGLSNRRRHLYGASGGLIGSLTRQYSAIGSTRGRGHSSHPFVHTNTTTSGPSRRSGTTTPTGLVLVSTALGSHTDLQPKQLNFDLEASSSSCVADWTDGVLLPETEDSGSYDDVVLEEECDADYASSSYGNNQSSYGNGSSSYGSNSWQVTAGRSVSWSVPGGIMPSSRVYSACVTPTPEVPKVTPVSITSSKWATASVHTTSTVNQPQAASDDACFKRPRPVSAPSGGVNNRPLLRPFIHTATTTSPVVSSIPVPATPSCSSLFKTTTPSSLCTTSSGQMAPRICTTTTNISSVSATKGGLQQTASDISASNPSRRSIATSCSAVTTNCSMSTIAAVSTSNHSHDGSANSSLHSVKTSYTLSTSGISTSNHSLHSTSSSSTSTKYPCTTSGNPLPQQQSLLQQNKSYHGPNVRQQQQQHALELKAPTTTDRTFSIFQDVEAHLSSTTSSKRSSTGGGVVVSPFSIPATVLSSRVNNQSQRGGGGAGLNQSRAGTGPGPGPAGKVTSPLCGCGRRAKRMTVGNGGPNHGRAFYCCPVRRSSGPVDGSNNKKGKRDGCGFFKWESALLVSVTPGLTRKTPFSGVAGDRTPHFLSGKLLR